MRIRPSGIRVITTLSSSAPDCQLVTDRHGLILEANQAAVSLVSRQIVFLRRTPLTVFAAGPSRARFYEAMWRLDRGVDTDAFEASLTRNGDAPRLVQVVARGGEQPEGPSAQKIIHWLIRDVTESRQAEVARTDLQQRLATAQEDERRRVARDLHDTVAQTLTALSLGVQAVRDAAPLPEALRSTGWNTSSSLPMNWPGRYGMSVFVFGPRYSMTWDWRPPSGNSSPTGVRKPESRPSCKPLVQRDTLRSPISASLRRLKRPCIASCKRH